MKFKQEGGLPLTQSQQETIAKAKTRAIDDDGGKLKHIVKEVFGKSTSPMDVLREDAEKENVEYDAQPESRKIVRSKNFEEISEGISSGKIDIKTAEEIIDLYKRKTGRSEASSADPYADYTNEELKDHVNNLNSAGEMAKILISKGSSAKAIEFAKDYYNYRDKDGISETVSKKALMIKDALEKMGLKNEVEDLNKLFEKEDKLVVEKKLTEKEQKYLKSLSPERIDLMKENHIQNLGGLLHDEWRASRKKEDGSYEPRFKTTLDENWIKKNEGKKEVDIANTEFKDLPADWQGENRLSADVAMKEIYKNLLAEWYTYSLNDDSFIEKVSKEIHDKWMERKKNSGYSQEKINFIHEKVNPTVEDKEYLNKWSYDEKNMIPYEKLSEEEKEKDRVIIKKGIEVFRQPL